MANLDSIQTLLDEIRTILIETKTLRSAARDVVVLSGLSDISERLGLVQAGEFRTGNGKDPGNGFTGVRIGYPTFTYSGEEWNIVGVNNDVLQFGARATDGTLVAGAGNVVLDGSGILIKQGEFRAGTGTPGVGGGFTGVRLGYPPFSYLSTDWNFVGVAADVLQFGLSASDGKAYFAAGTAVIDSAGITLRSSTAKGPSATVQLLWKDAAAVLSGKVAAFTVTSPNESGIESVGIQKTTGYTPVAHLMTADSSLNFLTGLEIRGDGDIQLDLRTASVDTGGAQRLRIMTNMNVTNSPYNDLLVLEAGSKGTAANGFGAAIAWYVEQAAGTLKKMGYLYFSYTDVTNGSEDSKLVAGYLVNNVFTEKQLAP